MYNCTFLAGKFLEKPKLYLWIKVLIHKCCKWQKLGINTYCALNYLFCMLIVVIWTDWKPHLYMYLFQLNLQIKSLLNYTNQIASNKYHTQTSSNRLHIYPVFLTTCWSTLISPLQIGLLIASENMTLSVNVAFVKNVFWIKG